MFLKTLQNSQKTLVPEHFFFKNVAGLVTNFISEDSPAQGFPVSFTKFLNTPILTNTSGWLFCTIFLIFSKNVAIVLVQGNLWWYSHFFIKLFRCLSLMVNSFDAGAGCPTSDFNGSCTNVSLASYAVNSSPHCVSIANPLTQKIP